MARTKGPSKKIKAKPSSTGARVDAEGRATEVMDGCVVKKTKDIYRNKLKIVLQYMESKDEEEEIDIEDSVERGNLFRGYPIEATDSRN